MKLTITVNLHHSGGVILTAPEGVCIMAALENLTLAIDRLTAAVDRVVQNPGGGTGVPEADVEAAASKVTEQAQRLEALPTPNGGNPNPTDPTPRLK